MTLKILTFENMSIHEQLLLEEKLLRSSQDNFCLINMGSKRHIVMGISGKIEELVDIAKAKAEKVTILKRFSGGGTVVVDENTLFVTLIFNTSSHSFAPFPEKIHSWSAQLYRPLFGDLPFSLKENDYVIADKKVGGNAQYIKKDRWLHHTSFLWEFDKANMDLLLLPKKRPAYRENRPHEEFLATLKPHFPSKEIFKDKLLHELKNRFALSFPSLEELSSLADCRLTTQTIEF